MPCSPSSAWVTSMESLLLSRTALGLADQHRELVAVDDVALGAELAAHLGLPFVRDHVLQLRAAEEEQCAEHAFARAGAGEAHRLVGNEADVEAVEHGHQDLVRTVTALNHRRHLRQASD